MGPASIGVEVQRNADGDIPYFTAISLNQLRADYIKDFLILK